MKPRIISYFFEPQKCFIPKCKARCCGDAPLPEDFAGKMRDFTCREVYNAVNIGQNDPHDTYNSVIYNTRPLPVVLVGREKQGGHAYYFDKEMAKKMHMTAEEATQKLLEMEANGVYNYCPFLNKYGRCQVYESRPPICREFGTSPMPINYCSKKASRFEIFKYYAKDFTPKKMFLFYKNLVLSLFKKPQKS